RAPRSLLGLRIEPKVLVVETMAELGSLRRQVAPVLRVGGHLDRHLLDDPQAEALEPADLLRIVRQDSDRRQSQVGEDLVPDSPLARVLRETELEVRLHRVEPILLEL